MPQSTCANPPCDRQLIWDPQPVWRPPLGARMEKSTVYYTVKYLVSLGMGVLPIAIQCHSRGCLSQREGTRHAIDSSFGIHNLSGVRP